MLKTTNSSKNQVKDAHLVYLDSVFVLTAVKFVRKLLMDKLMTQNGLVIGKAPIKRPICGRFALLSLNTYLNENAKNGSINPTVVVDLFPVSNETP